jgi:hypothetical protein
MLFVLSGKVSNMRYYLLIVFVFLFSGATGYTQVDDPAGNQEQKTQEENYLYQWTDSKGVVHITDSLGKVPEKYRSEAQKLQSSPGTDGMENQQGQQSLTSPSGSLGNEGLQKAQKEEWQSRMKAAKQKLANAEQRYHDLAQQRDLLLGSWGGPVSGHLEGREEADRIQQQMDQVQREIDDERNEIEVVIPNEARKAGIPPGWLRE